MDCPIHARQKNLSCYYSERVSVIEFLLAEIADKSARRRADAVTRGLDNKLYFVEPLTESMPMESFLDGISGRVRPRPLSHATISCVSDLDFGP